ncbi:MAG: DRTGG domain-containing protein [Actinomycetota bacterium]|nr:DRTGG domain-containing protein [Actinomycetota bacterium]
MKIAEIADKLGLEVVNEGQWEREAKCCYASDMLSDVLANGGEGCLWITRQSHPNIVAVAAIRGMAGIIITGGKQINPDTIEKAGQEQVMIFSTPKQTCELAGKLYMLLSNEMERG